MLALLTRLTRRPRKPASAKAKNAMLKTSMEMRCSRANSEIPTKLMSIRLTLTAAQASAARLTLSSSSEAGLWAREIWARAGSRSPALRRSAYSSRDPATASSVASLARSRLPRGLGDAPGPLFVGRVEVGSVAHRRELGAELFEPPALVVDLDLRGAAPRDDVSPLFEDGLERLGRGRHFV